MRGAPQVGFSATIRKIKARTSLLTRFRPPTCLTLEIHVQYKRNPARCQFTTVLGVTKTRGLVHPDQNVLNATQNSLCRAVNRRRGRCACRASNCRRRARFSRTRSSRELKTLTIHPRRCRSGTIMARILSEKSESSFAPSHSFCECTTFWRDTAIHRIRANFVLLAWFPSITRKSSPLMVYSTPACKPRLTLRKAGIELNLLSGPARGYSVPAFSLPGRVRNRTCIPNLVRNEDQALVESEGATRVRV